jgi:dynein heavy chain
MILSYSERWPLMIDPQVKKIECSTIVSWAYTFDFHYFFHQLQGIRWIKTKYGKHLNVIRQNQDNTIDILEKCISNGEILLFENIEENIDHIFDNLIGRNLLKKGR